MTRRVFLHTLSAPELVWLSFFREFFAQKTLMADVDDRTPLPNRFFLDQSVDPANRAFDVVLSDDFYQANTNALPLVVLEDTGCQQLGLTIDQRLSWTVSPETSKQRADQVRHRYMIHCLSRDRGESRMLASLVSKAVTVFRDQILGYEGMVKIEPWSLAPTQDVRRGRGEAEETFVDTAVSVEFTMMEFWGTREQGTGTAEALTLRWVGEERQAYVRGFLEAQDPRLQTFIAMSMRVGMPQAQAFVRSSASVADALTLSAFVAMAMTVANPVSDAAFIRGSLRVAA